jgi:outer membrane protein assembly factor BamA
MRLFPAQLVLLAPLIFLRISDGQEPVRLDPSYIGESAATSQTWPFIEGKTAIEEVVFEGLDEDLTDYGVELENPIYRSAFLTHVRLHRASVVREEGFSHERVERIIKELKIWLASKGYPKAEVTALGRLVAKDRMMLIFRVERGPLVTVGNIEFTGSALVSNEELKQNFFECSKNQWTVFLYRNYEAYSQRCTRQYLFDKGFFEAKIPGIDRRLIGDSYNVRIRVIEGNRYRIGEVSFIGFSIFPEKEIRDWFGMSAGDIAHAGRIKKFVHEDLKEKYAEKGYPQFDAEFEPILHIPLANGLDGTVDIKIFAEEGKQFFLDDIDFSGVPMEETLKLRRDFPLKAGDIYVRSKFLSGLKLLSDSGKYWEVDADRDVETRTDEESETVRFIIRLTRKSY